MKAGPTSLDPMSSATNTASLCFVVMLLVLWVSQHAGAQRLDGGIFGAVLKSFANSELGVEDFQVSIYLEPMYYAE